jgi:hypothetical protein
MYRIMIEFLGSEMRPIVKDAEIETGWGMTGLYSQCAARQK